MKLCVAGGPALHGETRMEFPISDSGLGDAVNWWEAPPPFFLMI